MGILDDLAAKHGNGSGDKPSGGILDQLAAKHASGTPSAAKPVNTPRPSKPAMKPAWDRFKDQVKGDIAEPFKLAGEAVAGAINLPVKAVKGYMGLAATANAALHGAGLDQSLQAGSEAIGNRNAITSPLGQSRVSQTVGNSMVQPAVNAMTRLTGQPELVEGSVEAAGDIASLLGARASVKAAAQPAKIVNAAARNTKARGLPFSDKRNAYRAAQTYEQAVQSSPVAKSADTARGASTNALIERLNPKATPTPAQATGNFHSAALEQSLSARDPLFAERLKYNDAQLNKSAMDNLTSSLGKGQDIPQVPSKESVGEGIKGAIESAKKPVLEKERKLWGEVPKYPMPVSNTMDAFTEAMKTPSTSAQTLKKLNQIFQKLPNTVDGLQTLEREINSAIKAGTDTDRHFLGKVKAAIKEDFEDMGNAAASGDVALSNGKIVYPSKLKSELANIEERITREQEKTAAPDVETMRKELMAKGQPAMKQMQERPDDYALRLSKDYERVFQKPALTVQAESKTLEGLTAKKEALIQEMETLQPADDVAAKYAAAKKYSREEKFARFYQGAVKEAGQSGDQFGGVKVKPESIPAKFFNESESQNLIRAIGKEAAADQMTPHVIGELVTRTVDANTGVMSVPRAMAFVRQNRATLENLGLVKSVHSVIKSQLPRAIEAELEQKGVDIMGNPAMTALQAQKMIKRYGPAVERLYGAKAMQSLKDYGEMMELIGRNKYVSYAKGSTTVEKATMAGDMAERVGTLGAVVAGHGWIYSAAKNIVKGMMGPASKYSRTQVENLLKDALVNPESAQALMKIAKAGKGADLKAMAKDAMKPFLKESAKATAAGAAKASTMKQEGNDEPETGDQAQ